MARMRGIVWRGWGVRAWGWAEKAGVLNCDELQLRLLICDLTCLGNIRESEESRGSIGLALVEGRWSASAFAPRCVQRRRRR